jgi:hypothetical protein
MPVQSEKPTTVCAGEQPAGGEERQGGCLACLQRTVFLDMFNKDASFQTFLRKLVLMNGLGVSIVAFFFFASRVMNLASGSIVATAPLYVSFFYSLLMITTSMVSYFWSMRRLYVSDLVLAVPLYGTVTAGLLVTIINPSYPIVAPMASAAVFASICAMPYGAIYYAYCAIIYCVGAYNFAAIASGGQPLAMEGYEVATFRSVLTNGLSGLVILALPIIGCVMQMKQYNKMLAAAHNAADLSRCAAELLRHYDTDGVSRVLEEYRALPDPDPALMASYEALVVNLNQYRPHLPNWMIRTDDDDDEEDADSKVTMTARSTRSMVSQSQSQQSSSQQSASASQSARGLSHASRELAASREAVAGLVTPVVGTIALALVEFTARDASITARGAAVSRFVDHMHHIAGATQCALHSFIGDTVQLSWNAAMRATQPEVKAVRFLCRLATAMAEDPSVVVSGAAMCGKATTQFAGTGKVQALSIAVPWRGALQALLCVARQNTAFAVGGAMAAHASAFCETRAVDILRFDPSQDVGNNAAGEVVVHEVVKERDDDNDEWMYVLDKKKDPVTEALQLCVDQRYGDAIAALDACLADGRAAGAMVVRLRERAEHAQLAAGAFARAVHPSIVPA